ncbi:hypothetical protein [Aliiroseovarius sp. YM-037]|uniref:hypothetical protein n=1 Tax=Aliiroseovarius sp. YM-037 TaxID=3341728 RepID=UPI003A801E08
MNRLVGVLAAFLIPAVDATAGAFCDQMSALMEQGDAITLALPDAEAPATCAVSRSLAGGLERHCHWVFPYRSAEASAAFEAVLEAVTACLGPGISVRTDESVNHPDSYDLRIIEQKDAVFAVFAVSLKDKAALQATLVFLRLPISP